MNLSLVFTYLSLVFLTSYLSANAQEPQENLENSIRLIASSQKMLFKEKIAQSEQDYVELDETLPFLDDNIHPKGCMHYPIFLMHHVQLITSIDSKNREVQVEDGSVWKVSILDQSEFANWQIGQHFIIQPAPWYSLYDYDLKNFERDTSICATLQSPSYLAGCDIEQIFAKQGIIVVGYSIEWSVYSKDWDTLSQWKENERILIGRNTYSASKRDFPYILININQNTFVRARLY
ncbi:MAG: hypothetical protein K0S07_759 [Chlamydiales bacterium]|jgi:hypothetical protein|nr:hypothetical protein [Chlamydiales bacterium]